MDLISYYLNFDDFRSKEEKVLKKHFLRYYTVLVPYYIGFFRIFLRIFVLKAGEGQKSATNCHVLFE